jgi:hypothetical protein
MGIVEWLLVESTIKRDFFNSFYVAMFIIMVIAIVMMLYLAGSRQYNFYAVVELLYHVLTEAGPGLIIMVIAAERLKIIDIKFLHDEAWKWRWK